MYLVEFSEMFSRVLSEILVFHTDMIMTKSLQRNTVSSAFAAPGNISRINK